jgi:hypothetical protein
MPYYFADGFDYPEAFKKVPIKEVLNINERIVLEQATATKDMKTLADLIENWFEVCQAFKMCRSDLRYLNVTPWVNALKAAYERICCFVRDNISTEDILGLFVAIARENNGATDRSGWYQCYDQMRLESKHDDFMRNMLRLMRGETMHFSTIF